MKSRCLLLLTLLFTAAACNHSPPLPPPETELRTIITTLSSPSFQGRGVNTPGLDKAASYLQNKYTAAGLHPLLQDFPYTTVTGPTPDTFLSHATPQDFTVNSLSGEGPFTGPLAFVGYAISNAPPSPKVSRRVPAPSSPPYNDFSNIDLKGKIALILRFEPHTEKGTSRFTPTGWSPSAYLRTKFTACAAHGAIAILLVNPPHFHTDDPLPPFSYAGPSAQSPIPVLQITPDFANSLLKQSGAPTLETLQSQIDTTGHPSSLDLNITLSGSVSLQKQTRHLHNILATLPGTGPHSNEFIVLGAHYDHLGLGGPGSLAPGSRAIHPGADDNASGTAALLLLAQLFSSNHLPHDRSLLFASFSGEEEGLLGSNYFTHHPTVPLDHIIAMLNLDMVGRLKNQTLYIGGAGTASPFDQFLKDAQSPNPPSPPSRAGASPPRLSPPLPPLLFKSFGRGGLGPSDHMSFALAKIPVLFLFTGIHSDYHRPTDTPDKINYPGLAQIVSLAQTLTQDLSSMPRTPYLSSSDNQTPDPTSLPQSTPHASLGVIPDYSSDSSTQGVRITGTTPHSPAQSAGLQSGDTLTQFNSQKIANLYDLTNALSTSKPGDQVTLHFTRNNKPQTTTATLTSRHTP